MDIAELVLDYLKVFTWPLVVIVVVMFFRPQIRDLLRRAKTIDAMGMVNMELAEEAAENREALAEARSEIEEPSSGKQSLAEAAPSRHARGTGVLTSARTSLESIRSIEHDLAAIPINSVRRARHSKHRLDLALAAVALAFGHATFDHETATALAAQTGQLAWLDLLETQRKVQEIISREAYVPNVRETRRQLINEGVSTIEALLEQLIRRSPDVAAESA